MECLLRINGFLLAKRYCLLWQQQTSKDIPLSHIYTVVYGKNATSEWIENLLYHKKSRWILNVNEEENRFCKWLWKDEEATEFLLLAKQCEETRDRMASPWYYPSKKDPDKMSLSQIVERADEYEGKRFTDRYLLQIERALFSLHEYEAGDVESVLCCARSADGDYLSVMYEYTPSSRELRDAVERIVLSAEQMLWNSGGVVPFDYVSRIEDETRTRLEQVRALAIKIATENKVDDPDLWYYTAAFIDHMLGRNSDAYWLLAKAESSRGSQYIKESVKVLKIYLEALGPYNRSYESRMVEGVKWLESKVVEHLDEGRSETISYGMYYTGINLSYFYWNDMLRKIVHAAIVPRLLKSNKEALAIAFSNMADNMIFKSAESVLIMRKYSSESCSTCQSRSAFERRSPGKP